MKHTIAIILLVFVSAPAWAQGRGGQPPQSPPPAGDATPRVETAGEKEEKISQTSHTMRLDGRDIKYTATTGTLPIRSDDGKIAARMFFVAYTKDGEDVKTRPVAFLYNGGPGAATIWLALPGLREERAEMGIGPANDIAKFIQGTRGSGPVRGTSQP